MPSSKYLSIVHGYCRIDNQLLRFWIRLKQFDECLRLYREMKRRNCRIDSDLENYMYLRFYREKSELNENDKKMLKFLTKQLMA